MGDEFIVLTWKNLCRCIRSVRGDGRTDDGKRGLCHKSFDERDDWKRRGGVGVNVSAVVQCLKCSLCLIGEDIALVHPGIQVRSQQSAIRYESSRRTDFSCNVEVACNVI